MINPGHDKREDISIMRKFLSVMFAFCLMICAGFAGCNHSDSSGTESSDIASSTEPMIKTLSGAVQKGPYLNGTSLTFFELSETLSQTGKSYNAQIKDNSGNYSLNDIAFTSNYVMIKADGFYYDEVTGKVSESLLPLYALSDIEDKTTVNVNLMSHMEKDRIEYLMENGSAFTEAKAQAQQEILHIFSISKTDLPESELLNITEAGDNNGVLLAVSLILQGLRTTAELSELLANIATDIRTDGELNSAQLGTMLINDIARMNLEKIRTNLEARYLEIGLPITIPPFEQFVDAFIQNTTYIRTSGITYPETGAYGVNLLGTQTSFIIEGELCKLSFSAYVPERSSLIIKIVPPTPDYAIKYTTTDFTGWKYEQFYSDKKIDIQLSAVEFDMVCDMEVKVYINPGTYKVEYYENGSATPVKEKQFTVRSSTIASNLPGWATYVHPGISPSILSSSAYTNSGFSSSGASSVYTSSESASS